MSTPSAPAAPVAETPAAVLGTGAYGDPADPELSREEFREANPDAPEPENSSSAPIVVVGPEGAGDPNAALPVADPTPMQAPGTPAGTAAGSPVTPEQAAAATS
jgi:hypothetical protein